ncbi:MAG: cohesin domain-containing protein [Caldilineaceae bacterium]|nr:hypothetical protein [Caldilineaceae bacterium]
MRSFKRIAERVSLLFGVFAALMVVGWAGLQSPLDAATSQAEITFSPSLAQLPSAGTMPISITVQNVEDLFGLELDLLFDPSVLIVDSIQPGNFIGADFVVEDDVDMAAGRAVLAYTQIGGQPQSGSGVIAVLNVRRASCLGESPLRLENVILSDNNGVAISHTLATGQTASGAAALERSIAGALFHDADGDGAQGTGDTGLSSWPVYAQRYSLQPVGAVRQALTTQEGAFEIGDLACGRYQMWSLNGETRVLTQTVDVAVDTDLQLPALPITGTLAYPLPQLFLPGIAR